MIASYIGHALDKPLKFFLKILPFSPNSFSFFGLFTAFISTIFIIDGSKFGAALILISGFFDILDGVAARTKGKGTPFGAFLDSVFDRISDSLFFIGLTIFFFLKNDGEGILICVATMALSLIISYIKARAEGIGRTCKVGLIERPERLIIISLGIYSGMIKESLMLLGLLSFITVIQRIFYVYMQK